MRKEAVQLALDFNVDENFILDNYDHLIFEGGKQLKDMVYPRMPLSKPHQEV